MLLSRTEARSQERAVNIVLGIVFFQAESPQKVMNQASRGL